VGPKTVINYLQNKIPSGIYKIEKQFLNCVVSGAVTSAYLLTFSMEQTPSLETNRFEAGQEIPRNLWNPKVHYRVHKYPHTLYILSQLNLVLIPISNFLKMFQ
jgi:hypothetical protein